MSRETFSSVVAKFGRGGQHCEILKNAIGFAVFRNTGYAVKFDREGEAADILHRGHFTRDPPFAQWGTIFGDAIHCHRCALDHLAWHLTCVTSGPPPEPLPRNSPWRDVAFPIVPNPDHWEDVSAKKLWGVKQELLATFKSLQPFSTHKADPDRAPLTILERLWNMDKHRSIHFVDLTIWPDRMRLLWTGSDTEIRTRDLGKWAHKWRPGTGDEGAPLVAQRLLDPLSKSRESEVDVDFGLVADVSLPEGPPAFGETVLKLLAEQNAAVKDVIRVFHEHLGGSDADWDEWERVAQEVAPPPSVIPHGRPEEPR